LAEGSLNEIKISSLIFHGKIPQIKRNKSAEFFLLKDLRKKKRISREDARPQSLVRSIPVRTYSIASLREKLGIYFLPAALSGLVEIFFQISSPTCFPCLLPSSMAVM
jgi:hypothetical protein